MATTIGDSNCTRCILNKDALRVCLMGQGPVTSQVMLIGEAPGRTEDETGKPFQGKAGNILNEELARVGIARGDVYVTNAVRCRPPHNRKPKAAEIRACSVWLRKEMANVKPKFVLLMGKTAISTTPFWGRLAIGKARGKIHEEDGIFYMATYHPAACMPGRDTGRERMLPAFRVDLQAFANLVKSGGPGKGSALHYRIVQNGIDFMEMLDNIHVEPKPSYDLETMGLNPHQKGVDIVLAGFGTEHVQWILPINYPQTDGSNLAPFKTRKTRREAWDLIANALRNKKVTTHNGKFDCLWSLNKYGVLPEIGFDTMIAHYLTDENAPHSLKYLASLFFGVGDWSLDMSGAWWLRYPLEQTAPYLANDLYYTRKLRTVLFEKLRDDPKLLLFYRTILLPAYKMFIKVEKNGMYLHPENYEIARKEISGQVVKHGMVLNQVNAGMNWRSPPQVGKMLFDTLGLPCLKKTKSGKGRSTDESTLLELSHHPEGKKRVKILRDNDNVKIHGSSKQIVWWEGKKSEIVDSLLAYRSATKMKAFVDSWAEHAIDGIIHASYKFLTVTGRLSCADPNIQNTPRDQILRSCYDAPYPFVFVEGDHSQVELRGVAMFAGETRMKQMFIDKVDIHTATARDVIGISNPTSADRKKAKAVNFGLIYRMGWRKLQRYAKDKYGVIFSDAECKRIVKVFFERYARLRYYYEKQERLARLNGQVRHPLGRIRHLPDIYSDDENEVQAAIRFAINAPVQGFASDYNLAGLLDVSEAFSEDTVRIASAVHDSGLMWVHVLELRNALPRIKTIMEHPPRIKNILEFTPSVPWQVDFKIGPWGKGKEVDVNSWTDWEKFKSDLKESGQWEKFVRARKESKETLLSHSLESRIIGRVQWPTTTLTRKG